MKVRWSKGRDKPDSLTCTRDDGSVSLTQLRPGFGPEHDFAHFAVESVLRRRQSFFGLVAGGMNIQDFEQSGVRQALDLPDEAQQTEAFVYQLQIELRQGARQDEFLGTVRMSCQRQGLPVPEDCDEEAVKKIRLAVRALIKDWDKLEPGEFLERDFAI